MNEPVASEIRFFSLTSRIGRFRYLAYGLGLALLAIVPGVLCALIANFSPLLGGLLAVLLYAAFIVINIGFGVRRLHDLDKSGWWMLLMLVPLVNLGLAIYLLFFPGTIGENRFGSSPPPNSTWVLVGAWTYIALIPIAFFGGILAAIAIPAYQDFLARAQTVEAHALAEQARTAALTYYADNARWPDDVTKLSDTLPSSSLSGHYTQSVSIGTPGQGSFVVIATMKEEGVATLLQGTSLEIWTTDDGSTWHCGPASSNPMPARYLSPDCRDDGAP